MTTSNPSTTRSAYPGRPLHDALLSWPVFALHLLALVTPLLAPPTGTRLLGCAAVYGACMFAITAGYHRYFAHRAFRTSRPVQFLLAWASQTAVQRGVLWWAASHRRHHRDADGPDDPHSPVQHGLWWAHMGWTLYAPSASYDPRQIEDFARFPELRFLDRAWLLPPGCAMVAVGLASGWSGLLWYFLLPVVLSWQATYLVNSVAHHWGSQPNDTGDGSRNNLLVALLTFGEGWHNDHHASPASARQGSIWWKLDLTWLALLALSKTGLIWGLRTRRER